MRAVADLAREAASHWGRLGTAPKLISDRENAVFDVTLNAGTRAALRLHRQGYQSTDFIRSELLWTEQLARNHRFPCPPPLRTETGDLTATLSNGRIASMVRWIDAPPIGANGAPFDGTFDMHLALYERLGKMVRALHRATDQIDTADLVRPSWGHDALLGDTPHWGRFWENPALSKPEREHLQTARKLASDHLTTATPLDTGLIHADLLQENVLQDEAGLHIIDFDDGGYGYRLFDLGTALIQHADHPKLDKLTEALCAGYGCDTKLMPLFIMLRSFASCGWIISRAPATDPKQRFYAERALICARRYLASSHLQKYPPRSANS